jgi:pimeloyl-ACP methyl ester carboxylesterase
MTNATASDTTAAAPKQVDAGVLSVGYAETGPADGPAVLLLLGVPTITLEGDANGAPHPEPSGYAAKFSGPYSHRTLEGGIGHNLPQEAPEAFAEAVFEVDAY